jgi:hypothetical protein
VCIELLALLMKEPGASLTLRCFTRESVGLQAVALKPNQTAASIGQRKQTAKTTWTVSDVIGRRKAIATAL